MSTSSATAGSIVVSVSPAAGGYEVSVAPGELPLGRELYLALDYDAAGLHAVDLQPAVSAAALGLVVEPQPGRIELGLVSTSQQPLPDGDLLSFRLEPGAAPRAASGKLAANAVETRPRFLKLEFAARGWELVWDYTNPGDTNQNSVVGLDDLVPLAANYKHSLSPGWDNPLRNVDCDRNGEVNISDISTIGFAYRNEVYAYEIQASADGLGGWTRIGEELLAGQDIKPGRAVRFAYNFDGSFEEGVWYRVVPLTHAREYGAPSEALNRERRIIDVTTAMGETRRVTVSVFDLPAPLRMMNAVRLFYPANYTYVPNSFNVGSAGNAPYEPDGIWGGFVQMLLIPPDSLYPDKLFVETDLGSGFRQINFNVSVVTSFLDHAPDYYGDLFSFELRNDGGDDEQLMITWEDTDSEYGYKTTYFSDHYDREYYFGNSLLISVQ